MADLKFARAVSVKDGALAGVTFWMQPFNPMFAGMVADALRRIEPQFEFVHTDGRRQTDEPGEYRAERERITKERGRIHDRAAALKTKPDKKKLDALVNQSGWTVSILWSGLHDLFTLVEPATLAIDFPDGMTSSEALSLRHFWEHRPSRVPERWNLMRQMLGNTAFDEWVKAYNATREDIAPGEPELGQETPGDDSPLA